MHQIFKKTINGHLLQFNRLLFPLRYLIKLDDEGSPGETVTLQNENEVTWQLASNNKIPDRFKENDREIIKAVKENELQK